MAAELEVLALAKRGEEEERQVEEGREERREERRKEVDRNVIDLVMELVKHKIEKHQDLRIHPCSSCDMSLKSLSVPYKHKSCQHSGRFCCVKAVERH